MRTATRVKQQLQDSVEESIIEKQIRDISKSEIELGENTETFKRNATPIPLQDSSRHIYYMEKPNLLTKHEYLLPHNAEFGQEFYNRIVLKSNTLGSLVRKFMIIIQALVTFGPIASAKMKDMAQTRSKEFLQREAWRAILLCSQWYHPFKILAKYNVTEVQGVLCKHTTNEPLAINLLGTDVTPLISGKDPLSKLLINKAHMK